MLFLRFIFRAFNAGQHARHPENRPRVWVPVVWALGWCYSPIINGITSINSSG